MTYDFTNKVAVVTGASRGLGTAIARTLAQNGARVILVARSGDMLRALAADLPNDPIVVEADLSKPEGWKSASSLIHSAAPSIDVLVNNAGVASPGTLYDMTAEDLDETLMVNVRSLILLSHALTPAIKATRGNIVSISSVCGYSGWVGQIAYATSKGAVNAFTRNASLDLGRSGVRVNAIAPGVIDDGMWKTSFDAGLDETNIKQQMQHLLPLEGRWGRAQDVADAVAWIASDKAQYVTGQVLRVDGGMIV